MEHGRDHDNRSAHIRSPRHNNTPDDPESEPSPPQPRKESDLPPAPTRKAAEYEAARLRSRQ